MPRPAFFLLLLLFGVARLPALSLVAYNVAGNGAIDWTTNAPQVQAIGRQLAWLQPDIVTFNEIPSPHTWLMPSFVAAYLPGYFLVTNSATDGAIRSAIASRFPIVRSKSWLNGSDLDAYGATNSNFTRDLFEAEINVPGATQHLHVFTTHLKAFGDAASALRRAAEAGAISNFFVNGFLTTNGQRPYVLTGDLNEDVARPPATSRQPIQRLVNAATGLRLATPANPISGQDFTESIRGSLNVRFDYILPCAALASNVLASQIFRTDLQAPTPPGLLQYDDVTASDHLPVVMVFSNPYDAPFRLNSLAVSNGQAKFQWQSAPQRRYDVQASSNLMTWTSLATSLIASGTNHSWTGPVSTPLRFFRVRREP